LSGVSKWDPLRGGKAKIVRHGIFAGEFGQGISNSMDFRIHKGGESCPGWGQWRAAKPRWRTFSRKIKIITQGNVCRQFACGRAFSFMCLILPWEWIECPSHPTQLCYQDASGTHEGSFYHGAVAFSTHFRPAGGDFCTLGFRVNPRGHRIP
jgi:hypothetical protein